MILCKRKHLKSRCLQRGYTVEEVIPCIVSEDGDQITVDETHPAYPSVPRAGFEKATPARPPCSEPRGPGVELKKLLKRIGIVAAPSCSCNARAKKMDVEEAREPGWCEAHIDTIVGWLREEATKRGLPFLDVAGRMLVRRAIKNARKAAS